MKRVILASQSPRRQELLKVMGVEFETIPSKFDEQLDDSRDPEAVAIELALGKADEVAKANPDAYVIGSDTIVTINGHQLEKPTSPEDAHDMLRTLGGQPNYVTTGVAVICLSENIRLTGAATTAVHFKPYNETDVREYVATGDPMDKAGGYAIQHPKGRVLIEKIDGRHDTVTGFPTHVVADLLERCGVPASVLTDAEVSRILAV